MILIRIIITLILVEILLQNTESATWSEVKAEHEKLDNEYSVSTKDYFTDIIPALNYAQPLEITLGLELYALGGYDAVNGAIDIMGSLKITWTDSIEALQGIVFDANIVPEIVLDYRKLWTPVIVLMNSADSVQRVGDENYKVRMNLDTGLVTWKPRMIVTASCSPDVRYFPFDQQSCTFTFKPWFQESSKIKLKVSSNVWNLDNYDSNGVWVVSSTEARAFESGDYYFATFTITIKRAPTYFTFNLVLPILLLSLLSGMLFLLPAASGERCGFGITCFLSFVVLLQTSMNYLPQISSPMSLLSYYLVVMILFTAFLSIANILLLIVYNKPKDSEVPRWIIHFIEIIKFVKCRRKFCRQKANAVEDESVGSSPSIKPDMEKGFLIKVGKTMPHNVAFEASRVAKLSVTIGNQTKEEIGKEKKNALTLSASDKSGCSKTSLTVGASLESRTTASSDNEDKVDWQTVGRVLDLFFLAVFLGVEGAFSFFFLVPLGTRY